MTDQGSKEYFTKTYRVVCGGGGEQLGLAEVGAAQELVTGRSLHEVHLEAFLSHVPPAMLQKNASHDIDTNGILP